MESVVAELLLIVSIVLATTLIAQALFPNLNVQQTFYLKLRSTAPQQFDIVDLAGEIPYDQMKVILVNTTTGKIVDRAQYNGSYIVGKLISAKIQDVDGTFGTGDVLHFTGAPNGFYEILVVKGNVVVFDGFLRIGA